MRIWYIPYCYLDSQRLQSQHYEAHGLLTCILKGQKWGQISEEFRHSCDYIVDSHDRCVTEMAIRAEARGNKSSHASEIEREFARIHTSKPYKPTREQLTEDVKQLRAKWEAEEYLFGMGRVDLRYAEKQLGLDLGRDFESAMQVRAAVRERVKPHRQFMRNMGDLRFAQKLAIMRGETGINKKAEQAWVDYQAFGSWEDYQKGR